MKLRDVFIRVMKLMGNRLVVYLGAILVMTMAHAGFTVVSSYLLKSIMEAAQLGNTEGLAAKVAVNLALGAAALLLWRACTIQYNVEAKRAIAKLEGMVFGKAARLPMAYYEENHSGDFMSKLMYDTNKTGDIYGSRLRRLVAPMISVVVFLVPMFVLCWQITLCMLLLNAVSLCINGYFVTPMKEIGKKLSEDNKELTEKLTNLLGSIELTKIFAVGDILTQKYDAANIRFVQNSKRQGRMSAALSGLNEGFGLINDLLLLALGIYFVGNGTTTIGELTAVYAIKGAFIWQFLQIGRYMPELTNCLANAQRIFEFLDLLEEPEHYSCGKAQGSSYICMEKVNFAYNKERQVLKDFSMQVEQGTKVALVGESGHGKSTIAKLLLGFYPVDSGKITIAGMSFEENTLSQIREKIAYVPQEPYLYEASIAENISYGKPGASMEEIIAAAKTANAHDFIMALPNAYETPAGERGNRLSGGEKQRIAIARAVLKNAPVLILDEATSALDNESEQMVSDALDKLMTGRTTIMIAHRPSTIARADVVISV